MDMKNSQKYVTTLDCVYFGFVQASLDYGSLIITPCQIQAMAEPPQKMLLMLKVVKNNTKIIISLL